MKKLVLVLFTLMLLGSHAQAQLTTEGTDFWFGFMENDLVPGRDIFLELYISSREDANIRLSNATGSYIVERAVGANNSELIEVPIDFMHTNEGKSDLALRLTADVPVSVYALNKGLWSADAAVILPTEVLGQKYYVMAHREPPEGAEPLARGSSALIVATADDTEIAITPSVTTDSFWLAGETRNITLNAGETYYLKAELTDLTGTVVEVVDNGNECAGIAVFGGNRFTNVGSCGGNRDHLYEQMFPVNTWGKQFLWVTYETRTGGDFLKVTAAEDNTIIVIANWGQINLDEGETETVPSLTGPRMINSNKPIQVAQFSRSTECDGVVDSDPFMIMLSPLAQRVTQATFDLFIVQEIDKYYITLITTPEGDAGVTLDGNDISGQFQGTIGAKYASFEIERGVHTLVAPEGVIAYVYGYGESESFGYSAGVSLRPLNLDVEGIDPILAANVIGDIGCINSPITFDALFDQELGEDPPFTQFDWDFGDGATGQGKDAIHAYTEPGTYEVTLIASDDGSACGGSSETISGTLTIIDVEVDEPGIIGTISVCPEVEGVPYTISGDPRNSYEWSVSGGEIAGSNTGSQVLVNWGLTNPDAYVEVIPINELGCRGHPVRLNVRVNTRLEPLTPVGNLEVCYRDLTNAVYSTPYTPGSQYEWFIEGGSILTGELTNEIIVEWEDVRSGRIWYREFNPSIADCEGFSDALDINIYPAIESRETISHVLCNGDTNGAISLEVSGGRSGPYTVSWSNGAVGPEIDELAAGVYTATITDALGCQFVVDYPVNEPDELLITNSNTQNVRCFQEANGSISVDMSGGTRDGNGNYRFEWSRADGFSRITSEPLLEGLVDGTYDLLVTDANGCTTTQSFLIEEPPLLEADLASLINDPICPNTSNGTAYLEAKGGTPDYQFFWSNNSETDEQLGQNFSKGTYTLRIVDANGCEATQDVLITERFPKIYLPNAFTPNGDGENDTFSALTDCDLNFSMQIFNEWGGITFATNNIADSWDGTLEGQPVPIGKYSYVVFYSGSLNGVSFEETIRGTIRLLR